MRTSACAVRRAPMLRHSAPVRCNIPSDTRTSRGPANGIDATSARRSEHFAEISAGSGEDDKLIGTLRLCAARPEGGCECTAGHVTRCRSGRRQSAARPSARGWACRTVSAGTGILSKTHLADAGRLKALRTRQRAAVRRSAPLQSPAAAWERRRWTRLVRSLAVRPRSDWKRHPCSCRPRVGKRPPHARTLGETSTADMEGDETDPRASYPHTAACDISAERSSAAGGLRNGLPRAHFISALRRTRRCSCRPTVSGLASSLSSSEGSAILLAPRASAGAVGLATRLMRVVDSGDVVQAEPSSGEKAASIVSFLKKSAIATKEQAVERHRKMHDTQRDTLCAEVTARKQRERYPRTRWPTPRSAGISRTRARDTRRSSSLARFARAQHKEARMRRPTQWRRRQRTTDGHG